MQNDFKTADYKSAVSSFSSRYVNLDIIFVNKSNQCFELNVTLLKLMNEDMF